MTSLPISTLAQDQNDDKEVEELANDLEFVFEEATIYDSNDETIGFDFDKLEGRFGDSEDFSQLEEIIESENLSSDNGEIILLASWKSCMVDALKDHFEIAIVEAAITGGLWAALEKKAWKQAAKILLAIGLRGNVLSLSATISYYSFKCI